MQGKKNLLLIYLFFQFFSVSGQETPVNPVSNKVFTPFIFNPAIAGSKDFMSVDLIASLQNKQYTQIFSGNTRLKKHGQDYQRNSNLTEFSNFGIGGYLFNDLTGDHRNAGISVSGAYHIPLNRNKEIFYL